MKKIPSYLCLACLATQVQAATLTLTAGDTHQMRELQKREPLIIHLKKQNYQIQVLEQDGQCPPPTRQKFEFNTPLYVGCNTPGLFHAKIRFPGEYSFIYDEHNHTIKVKRQPITTDKDRFTRPLPDVQCPVYTNKPVPIDLGNMFADGTVLRDAFSHQVVTVKDRHVLVTPSPESHGLVLLEPADRAVDESREEHHSFVWRNANIYFVLIDRFANGDKSNDHAYGRHSDGKDEIGTFHGGDLQGVINHLDYIKSLGTDAIWLSSIVEQIHGFVGGGKRGSFPFYGYHGYWARDFTKIDANLGTETTLKTMVDEAHKRGIKVLLDVVLNHAGYATLSDLQEEKVRVAPDTSLLPERWGDWQPKNGENWHTFNQLIDYKSKNWSQWWGGDWVRASLLGYPQSGSTDQTLSLSGLPDFLTESEKHVTPPEWLLHNPGTRVVTKKGYTVSDYLIEWQSDWVKRFGIDGFRVDTVKHVNGDVWKRLKSAATVKLRQFHQARHDNVTRPFWMMGEVWGMGPSKSPDYNNGFDALLNFDFQHSVAKGAACLSYMDDIYRFYSDSLHENNKLNPVSYISSHDTELFFSRYLNFDMQKGVAAALLLSPGAVQVFYGDEVARDIGPYPKDDFQQGTRSDMVWNLDEKRQSLLHFWRTLGQFRHRHPSVGSGIHLNLPNKGAYVFSRTSGKDKVVVAYFGHYQK